MGTQVAIPQMSGAQINLVRQQNPDLTNIEFDALIEIARSTGLNIFRRQISAIVFGAKAKDPSRRRVAFVIGIDGYRAMADRTGTYMPSEKPALFAYDDARKDPAINPRGIVSCTVYVKKYAHNAWHEFQATAHWDEFAPVESEWGEGDDGKRRPTGKKKLSENWLRMGHVMLAKVAEAQALRRGWPDTMAGVYTEDEIERERVLDLTASEVVEELRETQRLEKIGGADAIMIDWLDGKPLDRVPLGRFADQVAAWYEKAEGSEIAVFNERNVHGLREFWAKRPADALELKKIAERSGG